MTLADLLNLPCTITHRDPSGDLDPYGNETTAESTSDTLCELQQRQRSETDDDAITSSRWLLVLPAATVVDAGDSVEVDGQVYEVEGQPWVARNPRTMVVSHIEATLRHTGPTGTGS